MAKYVFHRLLVALAVLFTVALVSFSLLHLSGDLAAAIAGPEATAEVIAQIRVRYGLDQPLATQFGHWLWAALHLDFGRSFYFEHTVMELIGQRMPVTLKLGAVSLLLALLVALPLGVLAAVFRDSWVDRSAVMTAVLGQAMPNFWFALLLILIFAVGLKWLPVAGNATWQHFVLPAIALGYYAMPSLMRLTRSGMLDVLNADYIRTARAKGLSSFHVIVKHGLRNAIIPVVALAMVELGFMLGGSVVIESVFALQGLGQLAWDSISRNDFPVVQAIVLIIAVFYIVLTFLADVLNAALDPRLRAR
ncbi:MULTISPECIES: ABC transporter permease [unclassified Symbiopectobacterium]|uniref:ABC transporter permease n=1 Tax=unclassified Symbiopectobacterium TaxID=2794573 RepID=UPI002227264A|nr:MULTISPECIES: ABC transporter permease [unclassified Symbiopectobacterium]MCW2475381.1 ABC transporter permease [Candidatus Symbiopectobacterium sp. NZEC151]MCW2486436.1 ABC transporter permease [Candidatus Symbiopectobacterium sp. NZEC127]